MKTTIYFVFIVGLLSLTLIPESIQAQIFFETNVFDEVIVLENPEKRVMSNIKIVNVIPNDIHNTKWQSDVKVTDVLQLASSKESKEITYGSVIRVTGKAFLAVYGSMDISQNGVQTGGRRIEKVGQPNTKLDISGLEKDLYYAGKLWRSRSKESSIIFCTSEGIIGVNVRVEDPPWTNEPLLEGEKKTNISFPLMLSELQNNRWEVVEKLIRDDPGNQDLSRYKGLILARAGLAGKIEIVKYYLSRGIDIDEDLAEGFTLLNLAVRAGHTELVKYLMDQGADLNTQTNEKITPMMFAVLHERKEIEELLIKKGIKKDIFTETIRGDIRAVRGYLIEDPNLINQYRGHFSPLHWAVYRGHYDVVEMLIEKGADVQGHKEYAPPLFWAVRYNRANIAKLLIDNGADVNLRNKNGQSALFISARVKVTKFLLENGADPRIIDIAGNTPLHGIGTKYMHEEAIRTIISFHEFKNSPQPERVVQEAINEQLGVAKLLIENGADPKLRNKEGKTALDFANEGGFEPIIRFLSQ